MARTTVSAGERLAVVDVGLTQRTYEAGDTLAQEVVDAVDARAAVEAGFVRAVIGVILAPRTTVARLAYTAETVELINTTTTYNRHRRIINKSGLCTYIADLDIMLLGR